MADELNYCNSSGSLVGLERPLGEAPWEFLDDVAVTLVGCSNLRCAACGDAVASRRAKGVRHYECSCREWDERDHKSLEFDPDEISLPWTCDGHPVVDFPHTLDGVELDESTDYAALLRRTFSGWSPEAARARERSRLTSWTRKLCSRLTGTRVAPLPYEHALGFLLDADLEVRSGALRFVMELLQLAHMKKLFDVSLPPGFTSLAVFEIVEDHWELFAQVPDAWASRPPETLGSMIGGEVTLEDMLWSALTDLFEAPGPDTDRLLARLCQAALREGGTSSGVLVRLKKHAPDWVREHAMEIVRATPAAAETVLDAFSADLEALREMAVRLATIDAVDANALLGLVTLYWAGEPKSGYVHSILKVHLGSEPPSELYQRFEAEIESSNEAFAMATLNEMTMAERTAAVALLLERMETVDDPRIPPALAFLSKGTVFGFEDIEEVTVPALEEALDRTEEEAMYSAVEAALEAIESGDSDDG